MRLTNTIQNNKKTNFVRRTKLLFYTACCSLI